LHPVPTAWEAEKFLAAMTGIHQANNQSYDAVNWVCKSIQRIHRYDSHSEPSAKTGERCHAKIERSVVLQKRRCERARRASDFLGGINSFVTDGSSSGVKENRYAFARKKCAFPPLRRRAANH